MIDNSFAYFVLLHGYTLNDFSLMRGKMGYSLILFEYSRYFNDELAEKHAFELLQEVLAFCEKKNSFNNGKMGIAWSLIYLIRKQYIEAEYLDLYGQEHKEIMGFIKQLPSGISYIASKIDAVSFLLTSKLYVPASGFEEMLHTLIEDIYGYFKLIPKNLFEYHLFYYNATRVLCCWNLYEELNYRKEGLIDTVILQTFRKLTDDGYVCNNISFGTTLLEYGVYHKRKDIIELAHTITKCYFSNVVLQTFDLKEAIDVTYNINKLNVLGQGGEWLFFKKKLSGILFDKTSYVYGEDRATLTALKTGIPRLLFMECLNFQDIKSDGHYIMLQ